MSASVTVCKQKIEKWRRAGATFFRSGTYFNWQRMPNKREAKLRLKSGLNYDDNSILFLQKGDNSMNVEVISGESIMK